MMKSNVTIESIHLCRKLIACLGNLDANACRQSGILRRAVEMEIEILDASSCVDWFNEQAVSIRRLQW